MLQQIGGVLDRRGDDVLAGGPFPEIDQPAPLAAERGILCAGRDGFLANGTLQLDIGFPRHFSIVDGNQAEAYTELYPRARCLGKTNAPYLQTTDMSTSQIYGLLRPTTNVSGG